MKISIVGGGSTYTPELIEGLLSRQDRLDVDEIALVDIDEQRLSILGPLAQRMADAARSDVRITWGTQAAEGLSDATFVVSQIRVGGCAARERDEQLGREFGLIGQETVGVGGFANALRTIPVALSIAGTMAEVAPGATLFNFTNPAGLVTEALCRHGGVPTIGLCNVPWNVKAGIAKAFGTRAASVELDYVGLNHLSWVRRIIIDGVDQTDIVLGGLRALTAKQPPRDNGPYWTEQSLELLDAIPNDYLLYYYETQAWIRHQAGHPTRASEVMDIEAALLTQYADVELDHKPPELELRGGSYYSEAAAELMADVHQDAGTVHVVNTPNRGAIPDLPDDVVVEVSARVTKPGVTPLPVAPLRSDVAALMTTMKQFELLTVEAAVTGDPMAAKRALLCNPIGPPAHQIGDVWKRLREVNRGLLGALDD